MEQNEMPVMKRIRELERVLSSTEIAVGWMDDNGSLQTAYANLRFRNITGRNTPSIGKPPSLAMIAATLNYGREEGTTAGGRHYPRIPPRPFMTFAAEIWERTFPKILSKYLPGLLRGTVSVDMFLKAVGDRATQAVKDAITDGDYEPLSERTVAAKGSSKPLIDTGKMRDSVSFKVRRVE